MQPPFPVCRRREGPRNGCDEAVEKPAERAAPPCRGKSRRKCCFCPPIVVSLSVMTSSETIFGIDSREAFERLALEVFRRQAVACAPYREYLALIGVEPQQVRHSGEIPHLPIELFKSHEVYCGDREPEAVFTSSATTGMTSSRHAM